MKIVSLIVFVAALVGSWYVVHREASIPESVHVGIQNDMKRIITEYVQKSLPNSKDLTFKKFYTESLKDNKVKATFSYSFHDAGEKSGPVDLEINGYAILNKVGENANQIEWSLDEIHVLDNEIDFKEPLKVTPHPDADEPPPSPATPPTPEG